MYILTMWPSGNVLYISINQKPHLPALCRVQCFWGFGREKTITEIDIKNDCLNLITWHFQDLNPRRKHMLAKHRSANARQVFTNELDLRFRSAANPYNLALIESLAVAIKFLFRNNTADMAPLTENILPFYQRLSMWMRIKASTL